MTVDFAATIKRAGFQIDAASLSEFVNMDPSMNLLTAAKDVIDVPMNARVVNLAQVNGNIKLIHEAVANGTMEAYIVCNHSFEDPDAVRLFPLKERMDCLLGAQGATQNPNFPKNKDKEPVPMYAVYVVGDNARMSIGPVYIAPKKARTA